MMPVGWLRLVGPGVIGLLVVANSLLWVLLPPSPGMERREPWRQLVGEYLGSMLILLLAVALALATRARWMERSFGGLDKMYRAHRVVGTVAGLLLLAHVLLLPFWDGPALPGIAPGIIAAVGLATLILLALAPRIPGVARALTSCAGSPTRCFSTRSAPRRMPSLG